MERVFYTAHGPTAPRNRSAASDVRPLEVEDVTLGMRWIGLLSASAMVAAGCAASIGPSASVPLNSGAAASQRPAVSGSPCGHGDMAVDRGPYVLAGIQVPGFFPNLGQSGWQKDDLALRQVVILGRVVAEEPGAFGGEAHVYTPFVLEVERVIHGKAALGRTRVSIEGGTAGCYEVHVDTVPTLQIGSRYVLFLTGPVGTDPPPEVWDVWMVDNQDVVSTYQGPMPLEQLIDRINRLAAAQSSATP